MSNLGEMRTSHTGIRYWAVGGGQPILMLHGWSYDHSHMAYEMERVFNRRKNWRRIYLDLPGMGRTGALDNIASSDDVLDALELLLDEEAQDSHFVVAGYSYGGYLARGLVYRRRRVIDGVLLTTPAIGYPRRPEDLPGRTRLTRSARIRDCARREKITAFEINGQAVRETRSALDYARVIEGSLQADENFLDRLRIRRRFSFEVDHLRPPCDAPTLIILGRQDSEVGYIRQLELQQCYSRATIAVLDAAGHMVWGERSMICESLVHDWLDRVEEVQLTL